MDIRDRIAYRQKIEEELKEVDKEIRDEVLAALSRLMRAVPEGSATHYAALDLAAAIAIRNINERNEGES